MHELSVCYGLLQQVERVCREHDAHSVARISLEIGPLSGVEPELLQHAWPLAAAGTVAADATLEIEVSGLRVHCTQCGADTEALPNRLLCGDCGDYRTRIISGEELLLKTLELETDSVPRHPDADPRDRRLHGTL